MAKDVKVSERAWKTFIRKADKKTVEHMKIALKLLKLFPEPTGLDIKPLRGVKITLPDGTVVKGWRLKIRRWRALFYYDPKLDLVVVFRIEQRKKVYKKL